MNAKVASQEVVVALLPDDFQRLALIHRHLPLDNDIEVVTVVLLSKQNLLSGHGGPIRMFEQVLARVIGQLLKESHLLYLLESLRCLLGAAETFLQGAQGQALPLP